MGRVVVLLLYNCYLMGDRRRFDFSLIGFKPNPIVVCSDSQGGDATRSLFTDDSSVGSIYLVYSGSTRRQFSMTRGVIVALRAGHAVMMKPPSRRVWPVARVPLEMTLSLDKAIHQSSWRRHSGTLNESTNVGVKTDGSRVGGPELCV